MSSATPWGIEAREVQVEVGADFGLPAMQLIGLPDTAVRESRDRVRSAIRSSGYDLKNRNVVINLAPADLKKEGNQLDLAIALGLLTAHRELTTDLLEGRMACGELGLDGEVRPIRAPFRSPSWPAGSASANSCSRPPTAARPRRFPGPR